jgi:glutamate formiminotransferase/formiminotetrahydrofolate cyclodeaminase
MKLWEFANALSMDSPTPGGGSTAALAGSLAAALVSMVANLTHGNKKYQVHWDVMKTLAEKAQNLKDQLLRAVDRDTEAFDAVMAAFRLPKKTEKDKADRARAIEEATKGATNVPLEVMSLSLEALKLAREAAETGNVNSVSDAGVGALLALTAVEGTYLNVKINLGGIEDAAFKETVSQKAEAILSEARELKETSWKTTLERMS